ncbi:MAG: YaiI/YqxD family protein [Firmicutes bacterium]|nr:YaiI/YqxD family protein [Bacillota bacterium]
MKIIVDADACPKNVLQVCKQLAEKHSLELWTVASFNHNIKSEHHIMVGNASQEADMRIVNLCSKGDIVVTQDWGLAALILAKGAALSPTGKIYRQDNMDFMLEERELKAKLRRGGGRTKGPRKRNKEDDQRFTRSLIILIEEQKSRPPG